jgi:hypothetical protein
MALSLIPCIVIAQPSLPAARKFRIATSMLLRQRANANDGKWYKVAEYGLLFPYAVFYSIHLVAVQHREALRMRFTDDRYAGEREQFDLAVRLIGHEARTHIISSLTGFSQDRIRKLYATYFRRGGPAGVRRQRGKSPSNVAFFVRNAGIQAEASTIAYLFGLFRLMQIDQGLETRPVAYPSRLSFGQRLCSAYETYRSLYPEPAISFERTWNLYRALTSRREVLLADCRLCGQVYIQDALALDRAECPACRLERPGGGRG